MNIKSRLFIAFFLVFGAGLYYVFDVIINDIRPRYFETVEESMNDTVNILAAFLEKESKDGTISLENLSLLSKSAYKRNFTAKIYSHLKTNVDLQFYVCDANGIVLFDSRNGEREGQDFSKWNDVYLTLQGDYGVRSSKLSSNDEGLLYVAAPVKHNETIIGTVTVEKSKESVAAFIYLARKRVVFLGIISFAAFIVISIILSFWITSPIKKLTEFVKSLSDNRTANPPKFSGSEINGLAAAFENIFTELKGKKYVETYVNTLAHEIKSPLTSIRSAAELMTENLPEAERIKFLHNILTESERIQSLIEKMLMLSSLENRETLKSIERISSAKLIADVTESITPHATSRNIYITAECSEDIIFYGEYFLIRHSLLNLAENAIKHSSSGSRIDIKYCLSGSNIIFSVKDYGCGVPEYALNKVFDKFYSIPTSNSRKGTGLGLPFVKESAELHGGSAEISNNSNNGATAKIILPLKQ